MKKNSVLIELTPLLDVILIMLFFILVQSAGRMGDFYEETRKTFEAELEAFKYDFVSEMDTLRGISADYEALRLGLEEDTGIILISIVSDINDNNYRSILVEANALTTTINLCWNATARDAAALELNTVLAGKIQNAGNTVTVIVFRFDSGNIFVADHRLISNAIHIQRQFNRLVVAELDVRI